MKGGCLVDMRGDEMNPGVYMCPYDQGVHEIDSVHSLFFRRLNSQCFVPALCRAPCSIACCVVEYDADGMLASEVDCGRALRGFGPRINAIRATLCNSRHM